MQQKYCACFGNYITQYDGNHDFMNMWLAPEWELNKGTDFVSLQDRVHVLMIAVVLIICCFFLSKVSESCYFSTSKMSMKPTGIIGI